MEPIAEKSTLEIIPIIKSTRLPLLKDNNSSHDMSGYIGDPNLIPRIQKYLGNTSYKFIDTVAMADELQKQYREYSKRKRSAFRVAVTKAYKIVLKEYGVDKECEDLLSDESDGSEEDIGDKTEFNNSMNNQILHLYSKPNITEDNVPIDISSDDSEEPVNTPKETPYLEVLPYEVSESAKRIKQNVPEVENIQQVERGEKRKLESTNAFKVKERKETLKRKKNEPVIEEQLTVKLKDIGGMDQTLEEVCKLLLHIKHPELYKAIGITPPRGFLLHGPPGCGKTLLANAIAAELNIPLVKVAAPELVAGVSGESEQRIRELFDKATKLEKCVLFIDEIDAITQNRQNAQKEMERRIVAQLLSCLDDLGNSDNTHSVLVIGATNRPDSIDPALRRAGRFDREIAIGIPNLASRSQILGVLTSKLKLSDNCNLDSLAGLTPGFVGADLLSLTREAALIAVNRLFQEVKEIRVLPVEKKVLLPSTVEDTHTDGKPQTENKVEENGNNSSTSVFVVDEEITNRKQDEEDDKEINVTDVTDVTDVEPMPVDDKQLSPLEELLSWLHNKSPFTETQLKDLCITMEDFRLALKHVQPSSKREGFASVPDVTWEDVGSLKNIQEELKMSIIAPVKHAKQFESLGLSVPAGILLCGPPGCGKTLLAKAIANEAGINFLSVKGPELLNMYVGESERAVRVCFERARNSAPCVIFFDELDALCPKRSDSREGGATMRVVNQMLTEMDGVEGRKGVYLLAASNRPDIIDPAVLRPGRLDKILYVGLPTSTDRADILRTITKNGTHPKLAQDVDLEAIGTSEQVVGYTGADLAALVREASIIALKEYILAGGGSQSEIILSATHFSQAIQKIRPSVSEKDQKNYEKLRKMYTVVAEEPVVEEMEYS